MSSDSGSVAAYETWLRSWGASPATVQTRSTVVRRHLLSMTPTTGEIADWLADPAWSPWTRLTYYGAARSWFGWLVDTDRLESDPTNGIRRPRTPDSAPRPLSVSETARVLSAAEGHARTYIQLGLLAGLRAHEVAKIRGEDITKDSIFVLGKGAKEAVLPTHPTLWEIAQGYPRSGYWFPSPSPRSKTGHIRTQTVSEGVSRVFRAAGVEGSLHRCRHAYGSNLLRSGVNIRVVQTLMRHSSLATTQGYLQVDEDERMEAIRRLAA